MIILGVDPGLQATGYGVIQVKKDGPSGVKLLEAGTIEPKPKDLLARKVQKIYKNLNDIIKQYKPDVMVLEKLYAHYKHPLTASIMGHARGVIVLAAADQNVEVVEHSVKRVRKTLVGNGNATKIQTREVVTHILKLKTEQLPLDASDALALALGFAHIQRY